MTKKTDGKESKKTIPLFKSEESESEFWLSTDTTEYFSDDPEELQTPKRMPVSLKIDTRLMMFIKRLAKNKGVSWQTLMNQWLMERMREEVTHIHGMYDNM